jgi:hypothetical protein
MPSFLEWSLGRSRGDAWGVARRHPAKAETAGVPGSF